MPNVGLGHPNALNARVESHLRQVLQPLQSLMKKLHAGEKRRGARTIGILREMPLQDPPTATWYVILNKRIS